MSAELGAPGTGGNRSCGVGKGYSVGLKRTPTGGLVQPSGTLPFPGERSYRHTKALQALSRAQTLLEDGESNLSRSMAQVAAAMLRRCPCSSCTTNRQFGAEQSPPLLRNPNILPVMGEAP